MLLTPVVSACSSDDKEESAEEWMLPDPNNSTVYVEFDASIREVTGDSTLYDENWLNKFKVYGFTNPMGFSVFGNTRQRTAQGVDVTRNHDDETMWDYKDSQTKAPLKWANLLKYPISFYAVAGEGAPMASFGMKHNMPTLRVVTPVGEEPRDLLFAQSLRLDPRKYLNDTTKVELRFEHILAIVNLSATLADANDLDVEVQSAMLMNMATAAEWDFNEIAPVWSRYTPQGAEPTRNVVLELKEPVKVGVTPVMLQDRGAAIVPQEVKGWSSASKGDGAGIKLMARVRSKATGQYLAGSATTYGEVFLPMDDITFVTRATYTLNVTFHTLYNADGSLGYRASYKTQVQPWTYKDEYLTLE